MLSTPNGDVNDPGTVGNTFLLLDALSVSYFPMAGAPAQLHTLDEYIYAVSPVSIIGVFVDLRA